MTAFPLPVWLRRRACALLLAGGALHGVLLGGAAAAERSDVQVTVQATPDCPVPPFGGELPARMSEIRVLLDNLTPLADACDARADYHAWRGSLLLISGLVGQAAISLEKALMLNPQLAGAQLDYAQALAQSGQSRAARDLTAQVARRTDVPPELLGWLRAIPPVSAQAPQPPAQGGWRWVGLAQGGAGYESNLRGSTYTTALTLQLPGGPVEVALDDAERPVRSAASRGVMALEGEAGVGPGRLRLGMVAYGRLGLGNAADEAAARQSSLRAQAAFSRPWPGGWVHAQFATLGARYPAAGAYREHQYSLTVEPDLLNGLGRPGWPVLCGVSFGTSAVVQRFEQSPVMNARYGLVRTEAVCRGQSAYAGEDVRQTRLALSWGRDSPDDPTRPGGAKARYEALMRHEQALSLPQHVMPRGGNPLRLDVWARASGSRDTLDFSPLLGVGRVTTRRVDWGVGAWWPLGPGWSIGLEAEAMRQNSNNPLLRAKGVATYLNLRWAGPLG